MLLPPRCEHVATSLNRTVSGDTFPTLSSLDKPKCTGMNVYPARKVLNDLNGLKRDVKRPKTICAPDGPQRQKRTKTLKKLRSLLQERCSSIFNA
ncbi:hypothetical protein NQ318_006598 [Aromia moschata]|uniref:Uncharacterized protein n=1 Tax=Aromia moschata TaxID=1265417 RepID=A0AAV8XXI2_9CUCU|nr:hypothetical protein NQ318_006598 [Aromia moschata]